jgi:hypothetical protein
MRPAQASGIEDSEHREPEAGDKRNGPNGIKTFPEEESMTKRLSGFIAIAALAVTVAAPLSAQSVRMTATIPFDFAIGNKTMPSGEYSVLSADRSYILQIRNSETHVGALAVTGSVGGGEVSRAASPRLVFNRYGDHYVLAQVWGGYSSTGRQLPITRSERELAKTASANRIEILAMLMPR